jgi:hypothetical protein
MGKCSYHQVAARCGRRARARRGGRRGRGVGRGRRPGGAAAILAFSAVELDRSLLLRK